MDSLPLHPALVHVPLGLAMLLPLLAAGFAWVIWTGRAHVHVWLTIVALQALLVGAGYVSIRTGEAEEDKVETVVQKSFIHEHEARADQFVWAASATLALAVLVLVVKKQSVAGSLIAVVVVATLVVAGLAIRTGLAGGELVYVHGAASAYTSPRGVTR